MNHIKQKLMMGGLIALIAAACSSNSGDTGGSNAASLVVAGGFSGVSLMSLQEDNGLYTPMAATDYTMICAILVSPFTSGADALATDGSFSLSIAGAAGQPIGCMLTKSGAIAAVIEFTAASSGFSGSSGGSAYSPEAGTTQINFPTNLAISNGTVSVPVADVQDVGGTGTVAGTWADPTGTWNLTGMCENKFNEATGAYESQCMGAQSGNAPSSVYLNQISATNGSETKYGLSVWASESSRNDCGNKEGITLSGGWSATGNWDGSFTGAPSIDLTSGGISTWAPRAIAPTWSHNGSTGSVCNATVSNPGTTTCQDINWTGLGANWGMSDAACKLNCIISALNQGEDDGSNMNNWGGATCPMRYEMDWGKGNEFSNDSDFNSGNGSSAGLLNDGHCASSTASAPCTDGAAILTADRPAKRFMFGELFITGNMGTVVSKENIRTNNFFNQATNSSIECKIQRIEKMTIVQLSATKAEVTVENEMINHSSAANKAACEANTDFARWLNEDKSMTVKLSK